MNFRTYLKSKGHSSKTAETHQRQAGYFLAWLQREGMRAEEAGNRDVLAYIQYCMRQDNSRRTIQSKLGSINHYYRYLRQQEQTTTNPVEGIELKGVRRSHLHHILEPRQLDELYDRYSVESRFRGMRTFARKRNKVILGLLVYQGLRTAELAGLTTTDVRLHEGQIEVQGGRKSNGRILKLESHQILHLYDYLLQVRPEMLKGRPETDRLFINEGRSSTVIRSLVLWWKKYCPEITGADQIRTSVITGWLKMYNLREVQYMAGHRYVSSTERYLQNDLEGLQEEINQYHPL